jgi:hypothetical protein
MNKKILHRRKKKFYNIFVVYNILNHFVIDLKKDEVDYLLLKGYKLKQIKENTWEVWND